LPKRQFQPGPLAKTSAQLGDPAALFFGPRAFLGGDLRTAITLGAAR
jgi:hypothetical protein